MNAAELLDNLNRAGAILEVVDGKTGIRGAKISDELMQTLKANRAGVLAEFERRKMEDCDWRACVDVTAWQRMSGGREAAQFVMELT